MRRATVGTLGAIAAVTIVMLVVGLNLLALWLAATR